MKLIIKRTEKPRKTKTFFRKKGVVSEQTESHKVSEKLQRK